MTSIINDFDAIRAGMPSTETQPTTLAALITEERRAWQAYLAADAKADELFFAWRRMNPDAVRDPEDLADWVAGGCRGAPAQIWALYAAAEELRPAADALTDRVLVWVPDNLADVIRLLEHDVAHDEATAAHVLDGLRHILRRMSPIAGRVPELAPLVARRRSPGRRRRDLDGDRLPGRFPLRRADLGLQMPHHRGSRDLY
jgi:hypothetical protein